MIVILSRVNKEANEDDENELGYESLLNRASTRKTDFLTIVNKPLNAHSRSGT